MALCTCVYVIHKVVQYQSTVKTQRKQYSTVAYTLMVKAKVLLRVLGKVREWKKIPDILQIAAEKG